MLEAKLGDFGLHATVHANKSNRGQRIAAAAEHKWAILIPSPMPFALIHTYID